MKEYSIERQAPWLVGLPESWEIRKVKHFFTVVNGSTPKSSESTYWGGDITWITPADYKTEDKYICSSRKAITQEGLDSCGTSKVPAGSIIVSNRAPIGSIGIAEKELCTSQGCKSLVKIAEINEEYIYYYLSVMSGPLNMLGRGTTFMELSSNDLANFRLPIPTVKDQNAIVQILNKKIAAINDVINKKANIIELLQEQRTAVICSAVTKGIDSTAKMKDSGVAWLGEIPEHWGVSKSQWLFSLRKEKARPDDEQLTASQHFGIVYQKDYMAQGSRVVQVVLGNDILKHVEPDDFVISMRSFQGGIEWSNLRGKISSAYVMLIPQKQYVYSPYFRWLLKSHNYILALQSTSNLVRDGQALRYDNFRMVDLPLVPLDEQRAIADYLNKKIAKLDSIIADVTEQIEKLKEYRQSVISERLMNKCFIIVLFLILMKQGAF